MVVELSIQRTSSWPATNPSIPARAFFVTSDQGEMGFLQFQRLNSAAAEGGPLQR